MLLGFTVFSFYVVLERMRSGYDWPTEPYWIVRGILWTLFTLSFAHYFGEFLYWILQPYAIFDLGFMGLWGIVPSFVLYQFIGYFLHRALHQIPLLWRIHQHHHSSERLDIWSAYRVHPLEIPMYALLGLFTSSAVLGVSQDAAWVTGVILAVIQILQHTNIKTPQWLGYIVARPESHMLHHAREAHHSNYADLALVDMIFGTFENPKEAPELVGFGAGMSSNIGQFLRCEDVRSSIQSKV